MTSYPSNYEIELRKLVHCEDEPGHTITPYGRDRKQVRKVLKLLCQELSNLPFRNVEQSGSYTSDVEQSESFYHKIVDEIFYRALELMVVFYFHEACEELGYRGDVDGRGV